MNLGFEPKMNVKLFSRAAAAVCTAALLVVMPVSASAQELTPEHIALAREFVDLTDKGNTFEIAVIEAGIDALRTLTQQNPEVADQISAAVDLAVQAFALRKDELFDQFARVYAINFTPDELVEINAFYASDVGQKLAGTTYDVGLDLDAVMQVYSTNLRTEFFAMVRADLREQGITI
jgi:hypothetical protein